MDGCELFPLPIRTGEGCTVAAGYWPLERPVGHFPFGWGGESTMVMTGIFGAASLRMTEEVILGRRREMLLPSLAASRRIHRKCDSRLAVPPPLWGLL